MRHFCDDWIQEWCDNNGWSDLFMERLNHYWAFPPGAVMPEPIPSKILRCIKMEKGLCPEERTWLGAALSVSVTGVLSSYFLSSPLPILAAFAFSAVTVGRLEVEEI